MSVESNTESNAELNAEPSTSATQNKPSKYVDPNIREHSFDGIQEYDNNLPRWWVWTFVLCIVWAFFYGAHFHWLGTGKIGVASLNEENRIALAIQIANSPGDLPEEVLAKMSHDDSRITAGAAIFTKANCAMCHGADAYGNVGPNLRDNFWTYGSNMKQIIESIRDGRVNKTTSMQMPAQGAILSIDEIYSLTAYIVDLNRKTPKVDNKTGTGKQPEGDLALIEY